MAAADTARLIASLELKDQFSAGADKAIGKVGKLEGALKKIGTIGAGVAVGNAVTKLGGFVTRGVSAAFGAVEDGLKSLEDLETAQKQTQAVVESTGGKAGVTADQIRQLAEESENLTTVDDKVVQQGENMLLTFTNIGKDVFPDAEKAMVNLGVAMAGGNADAVDLQATAIQLGKALNDPVKGVTALSKVGVSFTDQQRDQIKAMVEAGDVAGAQRVILKELATEFGNAGEAAGQGAGAIRRRFTDAIEDAKVALARGFLPIVEKVQKFLTEKLADPKVIKAIEDLGKNGANLLDQAFTAVKNIPWRDVGNAFQLMGTGAKAAFDLFMGAPDWLKTAVLTGWGLNKLTGGGVVDFGKGLLGPIFDKFLGRGASPANPMWVQQVGVGGGAGGAGGSGLSGAVVAGGTLVFAGALLDQLARMPDELSKFGDALHALTTGEIKDAGGAVDGFINALKDNPLTRPFFGFVPTVSGQGNRTGLKAAGAAQQANMQQIASQVASERKENDAAYAKMNTSLSKIATGTSTGFDKLGGTFSDRLGAAITELRALGESGDQLRRDLAKRLGISVSKLVDLRHAVTHGIADKLGISVDELRAIKRQAGYDDQKIADKLGVSLDVYRQMREAARETASNTLGIKNKDWKPTIVTNVTSNFNVSARTIAKEYQRYVTNAGRQGVQVN